MNYPTADYFAITRYTEAFTFDGRDTALTYWHRPLHGMTDAFTDAGFRISVIGEPPYASDAPPELLPPDLGDRTAFVCFLFAVLTSSKQLVNDEDEPALH